MNIVQYICVIDEITKYMEINCQNKKYQKRQFIHVEGHIFKRVTHFMYLGHFLTQDNDLKIEISTRIQKGNMSFLVLHKILKILGSRATAINFKIQLYIILIRPKTL